MNSSPEYKGFVYIFIFFTAFYFMLSSGHFYASDEAQVFQTTQSLVTRGELSISCELAPEKGVGDKYYCYKGIGQAIVAIPYYISGLALEKLLAPKFIEMFARKKNGNFLDFFTGDIKIFAVSQLSIHLSALLCAVFYLLSLRLGFSIRVSALSALLLGTATIICTYSKFFHNQSLGCFALFASVYFIFSKRNTLHLLLSGSFLGLSILTRLEYVAVVPVFVYYTLSDEEGSLFALIGLKHKTAVAGDDTKQRLLGSNGVSAQGYLSGITFDKKAVVSTVVLLIPVGLALVLSGFVNWLMFGIVWKKDIWVSGNILQGLYGNLFSIGRSIFIFSPPLIISIFYLKRFFLYHRKKAVFLYAMSVMLILAYSKIGYWHATWSWGNRYLHIVTPFLMLPLGYFIEELFIKKKLWQVIVLGFLILTGFFLQILGMTPYMWDLCYNTDWKSIVPDINFYDYYVFIPKVSPVVIHWEAVSTGKYIDYWFYYVFKNYGLIWTLFFAALPLLGIIIAVRGILRIMNISVQNARKNMG